MQLLPYYSENRIQHFFSSKFNAEFKKTKMHNYHIFLYSLSFEITMYWRENNNIIQHWNGGTSWIMKSAHYHALNQYTWYSTTGFNNLPLVRRSSGFLQSVTSEREEGLHLMKLDLLFKWSEQCWSIWNTVVTRTGVTINDAIIWSFLSKVGDNSLIHYYSNSWS